MLVCFVLSSCLSNHGGQSPDQDAPPFACTAAFPWHLNSLDNDLFKGAGASNEKLKADVQAMVRLWGGSVLAGSTGCAYVFMRNGSARRVNIPRFSKDKVGSYSLQSHALHLFRQPKAVVNCVGWAFQPSDPKVPLAILTASRTIFIVNFETMTILSKLKGHGAVSHPHCDPVVLTRRRHRTLPHSP